MCLTRSSLIAVAMSVVATPTLARLRPCTPLVFNASTASVHEKIPDIAPLCYSFSATNGQHVSIAISNNDKMEFGVASVKPDDEYDPVIDEKQSFQFTAEQKDYRVFAGAHAIHGNTVDSFTLTVTVK